MVDERFDELSLRYLDNLLSSVEFTEFTTLLREHEHCRDAFVGLCVQTSLMMEHADEEICSGCASKRPTSSTRAAVLPPLTMLSNDSRLTGLLKAISTWLIASAMPDAADSQQQV